jgi:signal peptidase
MARHKQTGGFWGAFTRSLSTVLLIALVALAAAVAVVPAVTGGKALTVLSGSMEPAFQPGDMIVVAGVKQPDDLKVGDIVTYLPKPGSPELITHRIIGKGFDSDGRAQFTTQGDNNDAPDPTVAAQQIRGKYLFHIPYLGWIANWAGNHVAWAVSLFALALIAWGVWAFIPRKDRSRTRAVEAPVTTAPTRGGRR